MDVLNYVKNLDLENQVIYRELPFGELTVKAVDIELPKELEVKPLKFKDSVRFIEGKTLKGKKVLEFKIQASNTAGRLKVYPESIGYAVEHRNERADKGEKTTASALMQCILEGKPFQVFVSAYVYEDDARGTASVGQNVSIDPALQEGNFWTKEEALVAARKRTAEMQKSAKDTAQTP